MSSTGNLITLLSVMTILAFAPMSKGRNVHRALGNMTYPLYLYHEIVLIVVLTLTTSYAYTIVATTVVLSFVTDAAMMALVDPAVTRYRDRIRGRAVPDARWRLSRPKMPVSGFLGFLQSP